MNRFEQREIRPPVNFAELCQFCLNHAPAKYVFADEIWPVLDGRVIWTRSLSGFTAIVEDGGGQLWITRVPGPIVDKPSQRLILQATQGVLINIAGHLSDMHGLPQDLFKGNFFHWEIPAGAREFMVAVTRNSQPGGYDIWYAGNLKA